MSFKGVKDVIPSAVPHDYDRQTSFEDFETNNPGTNFSGADLDAEFTEIEHALDETQDRLSIIQNDDGSLKNQSVGVDQMKPEVSFGLNAVADWVTATAYVANAGVWNDRKLYRCLEAHTSGVFATDLAAEKWSLLVDFDQYLDIAAASATDAQTAETNAETAETNAGAAATSAADSAVAAQTAETNAETAQANAEAALAEVVALADSLISVIDKDVTSSAVTNTIAETTVYSYVVPGGTLGTDRTLSLEMMGDLLNNSGGADTLTLRVKFGGVTIATVSQSYADTPTPLRAGIKLETDIVAANANNAQVASTKVVSGGFGSLNGDAISSGTVRYSMHSSMVVDTTVDQTLAVTAQHSVANALTIFVARNLRTLVGG